MLDLKNSKTVEIAAAGFLDNIDTAADNPAIFYIACVATTGDSVAILLDAKSVHKLRSVLDACCAGS
jgi:hypothetical protein